MAKSSKNGKVPLLIGGFYPLTQIYQHKQDKEDGVTTISSLLGYRKTFVFCAVVYSVAMLFVGYTFFSSLMIKEFFILAIFFLPILVVFVLRDCGSFRRHIEPAWCACGLRYPGCIRYCVLTGSFFSKSSVIMEAMRENESKGTTQAGTSETCNQAPENAAESPKLDGRLNRSVVTRNKIVETLTSLILEGQISPTAEQVALRANVGLRTVFRHFDNMDALYREISIDVDARR